MESVMELMYFLRSLFCPMISLDSAPSRLKCSSMACRTCFGSTSGDKLFCLNAQTGQTAWIDTAKNGSGGFAAILDVGPAMLALPSNSELIAFSPSDEGYTELARVKVADAATYAHPVIAGNRIYVRDEQTLALWIIE